MNIQCPSLLISTLVGGEFLNSRAHRLALWKEHQYQLNKMMGGPLNSAGRFGEDGSLAPVRNRSDIITDLFSPSISRCYLLIIIIIIIIITTTATRPYLI